MIPDPRGAEHLAQRLHGGDATAEQELVERYSRGVLFLLRRLTRDPAQAEDLHQETFRLAIEKLRTSELLDPGGLGPFIQGIARHLYLNERRKVSRRKTRPAGDDLPEVLDTSPTPLRTTLISEKARLLRRMLSDLEPERDRNVLYRFYLSEEDREHICADLGLSTVQFNKILHRARGRFKKLLEASDVLRSGAAR